MQRGVAAVIAVFLSIILAGEAQSESNRNQMSKAFNLSIQGDNEGALKIFKEIEAREPDNLYVHNNLGLVYTNLEQYDLSIRHYEKALRINPHFPMAKNNLAFVYIRLKNYDKAEKLLLEVIHDFPKFELAYANLGDIYILQKRYADAIPQLEKAVEIMPVARYRRKLAEAYLGNHQKENAQKELDQLPEHSNKP